jgi:hypothetical protein
MVHLVQKNSFIFYTLGRWGEGAGLVGREERGGQGVGGGTGGGREGRESKGMSG